MRPSTVQLRRQRNARVMEMEKKHTFMQEDDDMSSISSSNEPQSYSMEDERVMPNHEQHSFASLPPPPSFPDETDDELWE